MDLTWSLSGFVRVLSVRAYAEKVQMTVLASGSKGNATIVSAGKTRLLVDAGLSCRELLRRMALTGEVPEDLTAILITHEHLDHVAGLGVLARRLGIPVYMTEPTHRAWVRMLTPRKTMTYAQWLEGVQREQAERNGQTVVTATNHLPAHTVRGRHAAASPAIAVPGAGIAVLSEVAAATADVVHTVPEPLLHTPDVSTPDVSMPEAAEPCEPADTREAARVNPTFLPAVEYFQAGQKFAIGEIDVNPFTIPHDAADPCGFVFHAHRESLRMAVATDLGYVPPNVKLALREVDVLLLESNHDLEMLKDGPYPWSVKQRVMSRVGHLSNAAVAEFLTRDYDGGAHTIVLGHLSEQNNLPDLARYAAEGAIGDRLSLLGNRVVLATQEAPLAPITL